MPGVYRPRQPHKSVLYRVLFHYFERFVAEYESRFDREYGYFRPIIKEATACHHEAWKAVVISKCLANGMRLFRRYVPSNDVSIAAIRFSLWIGSLFWKDRARSDIATAMTRKVYEVDPMLCPKCGGTMKVIAFITDYQAIDRIIGHLKLTFVADKPPPSHVFVEVALMAAQAGAEYF